MLFLYSSTFEKNLKNYDFFNTILLAWFSWQKNIVSHEKISWTIGKKQRKWNELFFRLGCCSIFVTDWVIHYEQWKENCEQRLYSNCWEFFLNSWIKGSSYRKKRNIEEIEQWLLELKMRTEGFTITAMINILNGEKKKKWFMAM